MIHHNSDLFYDVCDAINEHDRRQIHYLSLILNHFDFFFFSELKSSFITSSDHDFYVITF